MPAPCRLPPPTGLIQELDIYSMAILTRFHSRRAQKASRSVLLESMASSVDKLGISICQIDGEVERVRSSTGDVSRACEQLHGLSEKLSEHNREMGRAAARAEQTGRDAAERISDSTKDIGSSLDEVQQLVRGTADIGSRINVLHDVLARVAKAAENITLLSKQTNLLSLNAAIEAAKAGQAGRSFAVVASAVKQLATQSSAAAVEIESTIGHLAAETSALLELSKENVRRAGVVDETTTRIGSTIAATDKAIAELYAQASSTVSTSDVVESDCQSVVQLVSSIHENAASSHDLVATARERLAEVLLVSDRLLGEVAAAGGSTSDALFIGVAERVAAGVSSAFERALGAGQITENDLFSDKYVPVQGSSPPQFVSPFTSLCDRVLPQVQDEALQIDKRIRICCAFDRNGYLPTNHAQYSLPQSDDPVWNEANCRNRRFFKDRTAMNAVNSRNAFLVQTYSREMGNGTSIVMKDASAPILVRGRHWGAVRVAYSP
jgi:methyl-accepting chemotaxis protein